MPPRLTRAQESTLLSFFFDSSTSDPDIGTSTWETPPSDRVIAALKDAGLIESRGFSWLNGAWSLTPQGEEVAKEAAGRFLDRDSTIDQWFTVAFIDGYPYFSSHRPGMKYLEAGPVSIADAAREAGCTKERMIEAMSRYARRVIAVDKIELPEWGIFPCDRMRPRNRKKKRRAAGAALRADRPSRGGPAV